MENLSENVLAINGKYSREIFNVDYCNYEDEKVSLYLDCDDCPFNIKFGFCSIGSLDLDVDNHSLSRFEIVELIRNNNI